MVETLKQFNVAPPARARQETADTIERLRSLGYIGGGIATVREKYTDADDPKRLVEIEQMLTRANEALRAGRAEEAAGIYQAIIAKRPDTEDAYRKLALIYWRSQPAAAGDRDARSRAARRRHAERGADQARRSTWPRPASRRRRSSCCRTTAGNDPDAVIATRQRLHRSRAAMRTRSARSPACCRSNPATRLAWQNLGTTQLQARDVKSAETSLRRAIQIDPSLAGAYTALGVVLAQTGRRDEAIAAWKRALELDPSDENAAFNLKRVTPGTGR